MNKNVTHKNNAHKFWMRVDNAGKIYPAARRRNWTALFRVSATLTEAIDPELLEEAQNITLKRFPGFRTRLRRGLFWYYLEEQQCYPELQEDVANPCVYMNLKQNNRFMFRVRYYNKTIALEVFHILSDGTGGACFLLTLVAEYLRLKYSAQIPCGGFILDCTDEPNPDETEDAYLKFARSATMSRKEADSYYLKGTPESDDCIHITTALIPTEDVLDRAHAAGVTLTEYLAAVMIMAIDKIQKASGIKRHRMKPIKIGIPVNLRKFYPTNTLRNFASYINPGIDPKLGDFTFEEVLNIVHHQMSLENTEKMLNAKFSTNVQVERNHLLRIVPLFIKNIAMKFTFNRVGDRKTTTSISNLGNIVLPKEMSSYVERLDFTLGPLSKNRVVCGMLSYNGVLVINFLRTIKESTLEREFFRALVKLGIHVKISSNRGF